MSTASEREAALRRALQSAAEYIEPAPGGLERIQERLGHPRPVLIAWLEAAWTVVMMRAPDVIEAVRRQAATVLRLVWERFGPKQAAGHGPMRWLRPLTAMSVAVFVIGASVYVGLESSTGAFTIGASFGAGGVAGSHPNGRGGNGGGTPDATGARSSYPLASNSSGSPSACNKSSSTPRFQGPGSQSTTPSTQSSSPTTSSPPATTPPTSSSPPSSTTPNPGSSSPSADPGVAPDAGQTSGNPALAGANASTGTGVNGDPARLSTRNASVSKSSAPADGTGKSRPLSTDQKYNPCSTPKPKSKHTKKTSSPSTATQTSARLGRTQPDGGVAAKLD